jgi:hypothetical protein
MFGLEQMGKRGHSAAAARAVCADCALVAWPQGAVPSDWQAAVDRGDLFFSEGIANHLPVIGNGHLATVVGSDTINAAGVFNGFILNGSHR